MISGHASASGTARFRSRFPAMADAGHFRRQQHVAHLRDLWLSSIGIGTYLGEPDAATDRRYTDAVVTAVAAGVNLLDSAINYRLQRSERSVGGAVTQAVESHSVQREELLICTKAGYLTYDGTVPADPRRYFLEEYINTGVIPSEELVGGMHCMAPAYLHNQIDRSRRNLGVDTIDVFYLHNPEQQLSEISRENFYERLHRGFTALEKEVAAGRIRVYGTATWNGYRLDPTAREYLDLQQVIAVARDVAGDEHHFRVLQLPFNLGLPEAFANQNQKIGSRRVSVLTAAAEFGIAVVGSATLLQGRLAGRLPESVRDRMNCGTDSEAAIQFARSAPGLASALVGMSRKEHVEANLNVATMPLASKEEWESLFQNQ